MKSKEKSLLSDLPLLTLLSVFGLLQLRMAFAPELGMLWNMASGALALCLLLSVMFRLLAHCSQR